MLKLLVLTCAAVWLIGLFMGRKRRIIRNSSHLLQIFLWLALVFLGSTWLPKSELLENHLAARAALLVAWIALTYPASIALTRLFEKRR